ncbi:inactive protein FRIGIDA [Hordeum vulgare]|nr:inactive protein FRIGIDA [Hordeum vulgare]
MVIAMSRVQAHADELNSERDVSSNTVESIQHVKFNDWFKAHEFYELLLAGGCLTCVKVLRCSRLFMKKLRDVVADMLNRELIAKRLVLSFHLNCRRRSRSRTY